MKIQRNHTVRLLLILAFSQVLLERVLFHSVCFADPIQERDSAAESSNEEYELPTAPEHFADLVNRGEVDFEFYDHVKAPREFPAETHFDFNLKFEYRYTYDIREISGQRTAVFKPRLKDFKISCVNKIFLPTNLRIENFWSNWLVAHEFEHVRLNCDDRPKRLAEYLLKQVRIADQTLQADESVDKDKINESYAASVEAIRIEVIRIIQANNDYLDELTRHGAKKLEDPEAFFAELYTAENLAKCKFAYLEDVQTLLKSRKYQER